LNYHRASLRSV